MNHDAMRNDRTVVMRYLVGCDSIIKMSVGAVVGGICRHDVVVVHEAAPRVVKEIINKFLLVSLESDGLHIPIDDLRTS